MTPHERRGQQQLTQKFFWGTHSGVGGGSRAYARAADITLVFVVNEMRSRGLDLAFERDKLPRKISVTANVHYVDRSATQRVTLLVTGSAPRLIPAPHWLHHSAVRRFREQPLWRPCALEPFESTLLDASSDTR